MVRASGGIAPRTVLSVERRHTTLNSVGTKRKTTVGRTRLTTLESQSQKAALHPTTQMAKAALAVEVIADVVEAEAEEAGVAVAVTARPLKKKKNRVTVLEMTRPRRDQYGLTLIPRTPHSHLMTKMTGWRI